MHTPWRPRNQTAKWTDGAIGSKRIVYDKFNGFSCPHESVTGSVIKRILHLEFIQLYLTIPIKNLNSCHENLFSKKNTLIHHWIIYFLL